MNNAPSVGSITFRLSDQNLISLGVACSVLYALMTILHLVDLAVQGALPSLVASGLTMVYFILATHWVKGAEPLSATSANRLVGWSALLILFNIALHYSVAENPGATVMFGLYMLATGAVLLDRTWLAVGMGSAMLSWLLLATLVVPYPEVLRDGLVLAGMLVVGVAIHVVRIRGLRRLETLRLQAEAGLADAELALERLSRTQQGLLKLVEGNPDGMLVHRDGRILFANTRLADTLRYDDGDAIKGLRIVDLLNSDTATELETLESAGPREIRFTRQDGITVVLDLVARPVEWEGEAATLWTARDVTDRHDELQAQLMTSDRMMTIGRLAASVAHEINNPLTFMLGSLEALDAAELSPEASTRLEEAREGAERIRSVVAELLPISGGGGAEQTPEVDVAEVLDASLRLLSNELRHAATLNRDYRAQPRVRANRERLVQVFVNVLVNGLQAMEGTPQRRLEVTIDERDGKAVIAITDSGVGMTEKVKRRLFEPFFTTKPVGHGTGLGMHFCHGVVTALGGSIDVRSELNVGSTITIHVPAVVIEVPEPEPEVEVEALSGARVLVVDDEPLIARMVKMMLRDNHDVVIARSASFAAKSFSTGEFDAMVCDIMMPGMDGVDVYKYVAEAAPGLEKRIVFITGGVFGGSARDFIDSIPNPVVTKPFKIEGLEAGLAWALANAEPASEARGERVDENSVRDVPTPSGGKLSKA